MNDHNKQHVERRTTMRLDMEKELIDIHWTNEQGQHVSKKIACLDFSKGGLKLDCDQAIPLATETTVVFQGAAKHSQKLQGKVIRCIQQENGWFEIALRLDE